MLNFKRVFVTLFIFGTSLTFCQKDYVVSGPKVVKPGSSYGITVSVSKETNVEQYLFTAKITNFANNQSLVGNVYRLRTGESQEIFLNIPKEVPSGSYLFQVEATGGAVFKASHLVTVSRKVHSIVIQTDKRLYKPGQTCNFRVVAFDPDLKPFKDKINITVYDIKSNKIMELIDQQNDYGIITSSLALSSLTPLGRWRIKAVSKYATEETIFEVAEYVLPKFEVEVYTPQYFFINNLNPSLQEDLTISIVSKYTYGKPVKGVVNVAVRLNFYYWYYEEPQPQIVKILQLKDGKADIKLTLRDLDSLLPSSWTYRSLSYRTFVVEANVTETLTGIVLGGNNKFSCRYDRVKLLFTPGLASNFKPGLTYKAQVGLKNVDDSRAGLEDLQDSSGNFRSVEVTVTYTITVSLNVTTTTPAYEIFYPSYPNVISKSETFNATFDANGNVYFEINAEENTQSMNIKVRYYDEIASKDVYAYKYLSKFQTRDDGGIQLTIKDSKYVIEPNADVYFKVKTVRPVDKLYFQILAKELVVLTRTFYLRPSKNSHEFLIRFTELMTLRIAPQAKFIVWYVTESGELIADSIAVNVQDYFINKVSLRFNKNTTEPGDKSVIMDVSTSKDSYVGLLGVDQSVLLLHSGNDISQDVVSNELLKYTYYRSGFQPRIACFGCFFPWPIYIGGSDTSTILDNAGLFVLTNLYIKKRIYYPVYRKGEVDDVFIAAAAPEAADGPLGAPTTPTSGSATPITVRKDFPETFIWTDVMSNGQGKVELKLKVPDTITSWIATGFSMNQDFGLGVSKDPAKLTVIKPFFISLNLPYSIVRGEEFALQVNVNNYYGQELEVNVELSSSQYFQVIKCETKQTENASVNKTVQVPNNDARAVYFWIKATSLGQVPIQVTAFAGVASDAVRVNLLVKPEGQPQSYSASDLIKLEQGDSYSKQFQVTFPPTGLVPDTKNLEITLIGDIIGASLKGIEDLLKMPYGCGEQNLLSFAPDVYIVNYLVVSDQLTQAIKDKANKYILAGYQRQLTYQRFDGSFSAFGTSDNAGSTWLSAFTIKCFHQAKDFIPVEDSKIARTLTWIINNQLSDGTFTEPPGGRVIHTNMQGGSGSGIAMTAYVLISLLENRGNEYVNNGTFQTSIDKAKYLLENSYTSYSTDPYVLAIISYALYKVDSAQLSSVLTLLDNLAIYEDGMKYWKSKPDEESNKWKCPYSKPKTYDVELAAYVLLVYAEKKDLSGSLPIAKWLLSQRNAQGGFASTQDTVLGLEAIAAFAALVTHKSSETGISVNVLDVYGTILHTFDTVTKKNALLLQSFQLPSNTTNLTVEATGDGVALVQLIVSYNVETKDESKYLSLELNTERERDVLTLDVSTSWSGDEVTGMVLVEVNVLTGYTLKGEENLKKQIGDILKKVEKSFNKIVLYLDELTNKTLSFSVQMKEAIKVTNVKPALVKVYRYYDPDTVVSAFYSSEGEQTWEGSCPQCCP